MLLGAVCRTFRVGSSSQRISFNSHTVDTAGTINQAFTEGRASTTINKDLEDRAARAFQVMVDQDLPAFVTQMYVQVVSQSISQRITGTLAPHLREASEGLAEVFCLTDPSRPDNPIVFASEGLFLMSPCVGHDTDAWQSFTGRRNTA